ncbi:MAG: alpha/beta fold hydrolase [SAR202 cluster bacterium]|nr:alpha/beta fold hydrolase [SAR202 cluster bacterium]
MPPTPSPRHIIMPGQELWTRARGVNVRYFRLGQGPPVVLIHGLGESSLVWCSNMEELASNHTVIALDLPGHGASDNPQWRYSLDESQEFLIDFMDSLHLHQPSLIGNSMGGLVSLSLGLDRPERIDKLVLANSAGLGREVAGFLRLLSLPLLGEFMALPKQQGVRFLMSRLPDDDDGLTEAFVAALFEERRRPGNTAAMLRMLRSGVNLLGVKPWAVLTNRLSELKAPTLVLWGKRDAIFPVKHAYRAAKLIPKARLKVFDNCGHWPQRDARKAFNKLVLQFLSTGIP